MKQLLLSLSLAAFLVSCKKADTTPSNPTINSKDTTKTSIAKYGAGVTDIDGNKYKTVIIGTQEWMGENLKVSKYNDGATIPNVVDIVEWSKLTIGAWCNYNKNDSLGVIYGKIYNWYAVNSKKVCPIGWHVPSDLEWTKLSNFLSDDTITTSFYIHDSIAGLQLKETGNSHWNNSNVFTTNKTLFTALPGGYINTKGSPLFKNLGDEGYWWSSSIRDANSAWARFIGETKIFKDDHFINDGLSIRCIKD